MSLNNSQSIYLENFFSVTSPSPHTQQFMGGKMAELLSNKEGIVISDQLDLGEVHLGESRMLIIWIR